MSPNFSESTTRQAEREIASDVFAVENQRLADGVRDDAKHAMEISRGEYAIEDLEDPELVQH